MTARTYTPDEWDDLAVDPDTLEPHTDQETNA